MDEATWLATKDLAYKDGVLHAGAVSCQALAREYGTPLYLINETLVRQRYRALVSLLREHYEHVEIRYAMKANGNLALLRVLQEEGAGLDCVSPGEVYLGLKAGFDPRKIIYTGNYFSTEELQYAFDQGVVVNLDAISHVERLAKISAGSDRPKPVISFRVNPEFGGGHHKHVYTAGKDVKFGILDDQVVEAYRKAKSAGFTKFGMHMHIGSGILDAGRFERATDKYFEILTRLRKELDLTFEFLDFGGGIGIPYRPDETPMDLARYAEILMVPFKERVETLNLGTPTFIIEPGRYLVAEAGPLLVQVTTVKPTSAKTFIGTDAGFNTLVRPTMYDSYHHIIPVTRAGRDTVTADVVGPICESGDVLGRDRTIERVEEEEYLAILDAGAYGFAMSSEYNARPRPAEVLVNDTRSYLVRERETLANLDRLQRVPPHLK